MRVLRAASLAILFLLILAGPVSAVQVGDRAVPFKGETLTGGKVDLADEIGKRAILLKFGSIYCSTCVSSLEDIARIRKRFKASDLQIVGVNLDVYGIPRVRRFYRGYANLITYPLIVDEQLAASRPYDIQSIPAHVVIDKEGVVRYVSTGAAEEDLKILEDVVARVLRGEKGIEKLARDYAGKVKVGKVDTDSNRDVSLRYGISALIMLPAAFCAGMTLPVATRVLLSRQIGVSEAELGDVDTVLTALATYTLGTNLENLSLTGFAVIHGYGNTVANVLIGNAANKNDKYCLAKAGEVYVVFLAKGGTTDLDLSGVQGSFTVKWFNPRTGGKLADGSVKTVTGGGPASLGNPPTDADQDWVVLVR